MERTEDEKVTQAGIDVILGGDTYKVPPLVIKDSREWRKEISQMLASIPQYAAVTTDDPAGFEAALKKLLLDMPDRVIDLFFGYAKTLDRPTIEEKATDAEIAVAFEQVIQIAFPLAKSPVSLMGRLSQ